MRWLKRVTIGSAAVVGFLAWAAWDDKVQRGRIRFAG